VVIPGVKSGARLEGKSKDGAARLADLFVWTLELSLHSTPITHESSVSGDPMVLGTPSLHLDNSASAMSPLVLARVVSRQPGNTSSQVPKLGGLSSSLSLLDSASKETKAKASYTPRTRSPFLKKNEIDASIEKVNQMFPERDICKSRDGKYTLDDRPIAIVSKNSKPMVRVGGGFVPLEKYLRKYKGDETPPSGFGSHRTMNSFSNFIVKSPAKTTPRSTRHSQGSSLSNPLDGAHVPDVHDVQSPEKVEGVRSPIKDFSPVLGSRSPSEDPYLPIINGWLW